MPISSHEFARMLLKEQDLPLTLELEDVDGPTYINIEKVDLCPTSFLSEIEPNTPAVEALVINFPGLRVEFQGYDPE